MRQSRTYVVVSLLALAMFGGLALPGAADPAPEPEPQPEPRPERLDHVQARLIVGYDKAFPAMAEDVLADHEATVLRMDPVLDFAVVVAPAAAEDRLLELLPRIPGIEYAKRDGIIEAYHTPNDPQYINQWGPPTMGMESAWDLGFGNHSIDVGVIDTGTDYNHLDLADNVCRLGPDYVNGDADPMDDHYHGTHVAGTVAAKIDNLQGVAGMGDVCVVPIKVLNSWGSGQWSDLASSMAWAADNDIEIISMSLGGCSGCDPGEPVTSAIQYAAQNGVLIIAAAGNAYCDGVGYPAAYPEAIAVAALAPPGDDVAYFSSCGPEVEIAAPGEDIISTMPGNTYDYLSGTSMATPHVSGAAALVWSHFPTLTADQMRCILAQNADDILSSGPDEQTGYGRIDVPAMLANPSCVPKPPLPTELEVLNGDARVHLAWAKPFAWGGVDGYQLYRGTSPDDVALYVTLPGNGTTYTDTDVQPGTTYYYQVAGYNGAGAGQRSPLTSVLATEALPAPASFDFEEGAQGWTTTGLWHRTTARSGDGDISMYYGIERGGTLPILDPARRDYNAFGPARGTLTSPPLVLPENASNVAFWQYADLDGAPGEHPVIQVSRDSDPFAFETVWSMGWGLRQMGAAAFDLSAYAGEAVHIRFVVDADGDGDYREGWFVDSIAFDAGAPASFAPVVNIQYPSSYDYQGRYTYVYGRLSDRNGDADVTNVTLSLSGANVSEAMIEGYEFFGAIEHNVSGTYVLRALARDRAGNEHAHHVSLRVDADAPTVDLTSPTAGDLVGCRVLVSGTAYDTGGSGLSYGFGYFRQVVEDEVVVESHTGYWDFYGGSQENFSAHILAGWVSPGPVELVIVTVDWAWNAHETSILLERDDIDCRPKVTFETPSAGAILDGTVQIRGDVTLLEGDYAWLELSVDGVGYIGFDYFEGSGSFATRWDTGTVADGNYTLRAALWAGTGYNETLVPITVLNTKDPYLVTDLFNGTLGCSAGIGPIRLRDQCGAASQHATAVDSGLTGFELRLTWDADLPADVERLSVSVQVGGHSWDASAAPGDGELVLRVEEEDTLNTNEGTANIEVRAAFGSSPAVALDEHYTIEVVWAHWGAELP